MNQFHKGDARRLFTLLVAMDTLKQPATLSELAKKSGHNKGTVHADIEKLREQYGVTISKTDDTYKLVSWGDVLKKTGVKNIIKTP